MGIFLPLGLAFEFAGETFESPSKARIDHIGRRAGASISGVDQLDGADGAGQPNGREVEHAVCVDDLTVV